MRLLPIAILATTLPLHATLVVSGGHLVVQDNSLVSATDSAIRDGATVNMSDTADFSVGTLTIDSGGQLVGCGTIIGEIVNYGQIIANCGSTMTLLADVINHGQTRAVNDTTLSADHGEFVNHGSLDIITGSGGAPANLTGSGTLFTATQLPGFTVSLDAAQDSANVIIQTNSYHTYELETSTTLMPDSWTLTDTFTGDGSLFTWTVNGVGERLFYRINIVD